MYSRAVMESHQHNVYITAISMSAPAPCGGHAHVVARRRREDSLLHRVVCDHLETFLAEARARGGDGLPRFVERELRDFLSRGVLARGFARLRRDGCRAEMLVAFSCKGRGFCPSWHRRGLRRCLEALDRRRHRAGDPGVDVPSLELHRTGAHPAREAARTARHTRWSGPLLGWARRGLRDRSMLVLARLGSRVL